jgi:hypothetical protein
LKEAFNVIASLILMASLRNFSLKWHLLNVVASLILMTLLRYFTPEWRLFKVIAFLTLMALLHNFTPNGTAAQLYSRWHLCATLLTFDRRLKLSD